MMEITGGDGPAKKTPIRDVKNSGADEPAAINVAPKTQSHHH